MEAGLTFQDRETGEERWSVSKGTELFTEEELRRVCPALGIDDANKGSMV